MKTIWMAGLLLAAAPFHAGEAWAQAAQEAAGGQLSVDSPIGELLDNPAARGVLQQEAPVLLAGPQIEQARPIPLRALQIYAPTVLTEERLARIDAALISAGARRAPGAERIQAAPVLADPRAAFEFRTIRLWEGRAPGATGDAFTDIPTLTVVSTDGAVASGAAVIVAPGGGYQALASGHEGRQVADWFAAHGVMAFVLTYRLTPFGYRHPAQLQDAQRAIRWVRANANQFGIDPERIGMIGFSAGGHLTAMASTLSDAGDANAVDPIDRVSSRLNFAVLSYAPVDLGTRASGGLGLVEGRASERVVRELSPVQNVTAQTPPTFIFHTTADELVPPGNATSYYDALHEAGVPVELHIFAEGRHGLGLAMPEPTLSVWPSLLETWLRRRGMLAPPAAAP